MGEFKVLFICCIDRYTADPHGSNILRGHSGNPTGGFIYNAIELITKFAPVNT